MLTEAQRKEFLAIRKALDGLITKIIDIPTEINANMVAIRIWIPGIYSVGDVRLYESIPYKCIQSHDSSSNPEWVPLNNPALWMQYHGTSIDTARPWVQPLGSEDRYRTGEFMIWTNDLIYRCLADTNYSPDQYSQAWELVT